GQDGRQRLRGRPRRAEGCCREVTGFASRSKLRKEHSMTTTSDTQPMTREVTLTRMIDAPRALLWAAWTEPKHVAQWWGPHHFTNPVCEMDVRPGGKLMIHMKAPDGTVYPMPGTFTEVIKPQRLRFTAFAEGLDGTKYLESD